MIEYNLFNVTKCSIWKKDIQYNVKIIYFIQMIHRKVRITVSNRILAYSESGWVYRGKSNNKSMGLNFDRIRCRINAKSAKYFTHICFVVERTQNTIFYFAQFQILIIKKIINCVRQKYRVTQYGLLYLFYNTRDFSIPW